MTYNCAKMEGKDLSGLEGKDCVELLKHPEVNVEIPWQNLNGSDWSELLSEKPQFADKCDFKLLDDDNWQRLLKKQPQFAEKRP